MITSKAEVLQNHLLTCTTIHNSVVEVGDLFICSKCDYKLESASEKFVFRFLKHCDRQNHKDQTGWTVLKDYSSGLVFKTVALKCPLKQFFRPVTQHQASEHEENITPHSDGLPTENPFYGDPTVGDDLWDAIDEYPHSPDQCNVNKVDGDSQTQPITTVTICTQTPWPTSFEEQLKDMYTACGFKIKSSFCSESVKQFYNQFPVAKKFVENGFSRSSAQSHHSSFVKEYTVASALKHSVASAVDWAKDFGGPRKTTITNMCKPKVKILPYLDDQNLKDHFESFKDMLKKLFGVVDFSKIPVQASMDATATTGRLHTRRSEGSEERVVYGLGTPAGPHQKTSLIFNHEEASCVKVTPSEIIFNGMDTALES